MNEVNSRQYKIGKSICFVVRYPRYREVFAGEFRDRIIHHYIALRLEPLFEQIFCDRTYNCRKGKGQLAGVTQLAEDIREESENYTKDAYEYQVLGSRGWIQEGVAWHSDDKDHGAPVYRLYHPGTLNHHYTLDAWEYKVLGGRGWKQEGIAWYSAPKGEGKPVYRLYHRGTLDHHYTKDAWEYKVLAGRGWTQEGIAWYSKE